MKKVTFSTTKKIIFATRKFISYAGKKYKQSWSIKEYPASWDRKTGGELSNG
jgi:hypothetical protein